MNTECPSQKEQITVEALKAWLKQKQLPYAWLAIQAGVKESTVQHWMASARNIPQKKQDIIREIIKRRNHSDLIYDTTNSEILENIPELKSMETDKGYFPVYIDETLMAQLGRAAKLEEISVLKLINTILTKQSTDIIKRHYSSMIMNEQDSEGNLYPVAYQLIKQKYEQITADIRDIDKGIMELQYQIIEQRNNNPDSAATKVQIKNYENAINDLEELKDKKLDEQKNYKKELDEIALNLGI